MKVEQSKALKIKAMTVINEAVIAFILT